jgi:hypothetical protein
MGRLVRYHPVTVTKCLLITGYVCYFGVELWGIKQSKIAVHFSIWNPKMSEYGILSYKNILQYECNALQIKAEIIYKVC